MCESNCTLGRAFGDVLFVISRLLKIIRTLPEGPEDGPRKAKQNITQQGEIRRGTYAVNTPETVV